jgi:hypothetical protein
MSIALGATWNPHGEEARLMGLWPRLSAVYDRVTICQPPYVDGEKARVLQEELGAQVEVMEDWQAGRYNALRGAAASGADFIHYADMDRLLRWVETRPDEWLAAVGVIQKTDCLVIGRTAAAYATHPQALIQTEAIPNGLFSLLLGQPLDLSAGSKGFSRAAAEFILTHSAPIRSLGTDAEWPVLCRRGGFRVESCLVDGLDWESADRYRSQAADAGLQRQAALAYDQDAAHWAWRVQVADEIVQAGMEAWTKRMRDEG